jgi:hypothetical protein
MLCYVFICMIRIHVCNMCVRICACMCCWIHVIYTIGNARKYSCTWICDMHAYTNAHIRSCKYTHSHTQMCLQTQRRETPLKKLQKNHLLCRLTRRVFPLRFCGFNNVMKHISDTIYTYIYIYCMGTLHIHNMYAHIQHARLQRQNQRIAPFFFLSWRSAGFGGLEGVTRNSACEFREKLTNF